MTDRLPMEINVRTSGGVSVLEVHGRLTIGEPAEQLHDALESVVKGGARKVVVILNTFRRLTAPASPLSFASPSSSPAKAASSASSAAPAASATPSPSLASSKPSPHSNPN